MSDRTTHTLFVYGTLTESFGAHRVLMKTAKRVGVGTLRAGRLYHLPFGYPCIIGHADADAVVGEVYEVDDETMAQVTGYERADGFDPVYRRLTGTVRLDDGTRVEAAYFAIDSLHRKLLVRLMGTRVAGGDWPRFLKTYRPSIVVRFARALGALIVGASLS